MKNRIKLVRKEAGLTQQDFANKLNISKSTIESIEYGRREMSDRTLKDICRVFHISELWLRTGEGDMHPARTREVEIAEMTAKYFKADDSDFGYQLALILNDVSDQELEVLYKVAERWVDNIRAAREKKLKIVAEKEEQELDGPELDL